VANDVSMAGAGFNVDTNIAKLLFRDGHIVNLQQMSKTLLAGCILDHICDLMIKKT